MEMLILIDIGKISKLFNVLAFSPIFVDFIFWCFVHRSEGAAENSCRLMGTWTSRWFFGPWNGSSWWQVSASIKLFSNLLCTNFQITCQGKFYRPRTSILVMKWARYSIILKANNEWSKYYRLSKLIWANC